MDFFENTKLHSNSIKLFNSKLNEWINFMPKHYQTLGCLIMFPQLSIQYLDKNIKTNTNSNKHIYLMAVLSIFRHKTEYLEHFTDEYVTELYIDWKTIFNENEAPIIERRLENRPTDRQQSKGGHQLTLSQIVEKRDELPVGSYERLLLCMYTMIPPVRADYFSTQLVTGDEEPVHKNYIRINSPDNVECVLTDFKTAKTYKQIANKFPPQLIDELNASLEKYPRSYLFINTRGEPHTRNSFVLWTRRLLTKLFGTDFTLVFFRHAFITDFITHKITPETTDAEIKEISDRMGHSPEMFRGYKWIKNGRKGEFEVAEE
jgi:hypothetical protein